ncbi:hypothetical protein ACIBF6_45165 [Streptosporangium amethystogenes]|uniref:hypothetical protein n=1 Tax=Streptosporangium amethystogenes TaxID=2002 RepID=UPI0037A1C6B0
MESLRIGLTGPDLTAILTSLPGRLVPAERPLSLSLDHEEAEVDDGWLERMLDCDHSVMARWPGEEVPFLSLTRERLIRLNTVREPDPVDIMEALAETPFHQASFLSVKDWEPYRPRGFSGLHYPHGWLCAFRGDGHDALVSRRWLDHGPWRVLRGPGDLTLVQFHDLAADPDTAREQAEAGHRLLSIADPASGYLCDGHEITHDLNGLYDAAERCLRIIVHGRDVPPGEMLDACLARRNHLLGADRPIERVAYVFMEPQAAKAHLHELWLRELECWTIEMGQEVRLDLDHHPVPVPPAWVEARDLHQR